MAVYMLCERGLKNKKWKSKCHTGYSPGTGVNYAEVLPRRRPRRAAWGRGPGAVADSG